MGQAEWDNFLGKGATYMAYSNNRPIGLVPSADEATALINMRMAYNALTAPEKLYYAGLGGPNFLLRCIQVWGGGRAVT